MAESVLWLALWFLRFAQGSLDSREADPLQQALLLVDLLKAEYAKVRRENQILRQRELQTHYVDDRTCPTTVSSENDLAPGGGRRAYYSPENRLTVQPSEEGRHYYKSRRLEYDDAFGPHPGGDDPTTSTPKTDAPTSQQTTTPTTSIKSHTYTAKTTPSSRQTLKISPVSFDKFDNSPKKKDGKKKVPLSFKKTTKKAIVRDPIMEQVASEIVNEMNEPKATTVYKLAFYTAPLWSGKTEKNTRFEHFSKGTLKIHQATSRRYPLPLPENNAYCFFHPDSSLCRTFI